MNEETIETEVVFSISRSDVEQIIHDHLLKKYPNMGLEHLHRFWTEVFDAQNDPLSDLPKAPVKFEFHFATKLTSAKSQE